MPDSRDVPPRPKTLQEFARSVHASYLSRWAQHGRPAPATPRPLDEAADRAARTRRQAAS